MAVLRARLVFTFGSFWRLAAWKWGAGSPTFAQGGAESPQLCAGVEVLCSAPFHRQTLMRASFHKQVWGLPGLRESRVGGAAVAPGRGLAAGPFPGVPSLPAQCWGEAVSGPRCGFWPLWRLRPWRGVPGVQSLADPGVRGSTSRCRLLVRAGGLGRRPFSTETQGPAVVSTGRASEAPRRAGAGPTQAVAGWPLFFFL